MSTSFNDRLKHLLNTKENGIHIPEPIQPKRNLDFYAVWEIALGYMSRGEFQRGDKSAYNWAQSRGVLDDLCGHMSTRKRGPKS